MDLGIILAPFIPDRLLDKNCYSGLDRAFLVFGCGSTIQGEIRGLPSISKEEEEKGERDKMQIKSR